MSTTAIQLYNALIRRGIDQSDLYRRAASAVREPGLRAVFSENADQLDAVISDLQAQVRARGGEPADHGTWRGAARRALTRVWGEQDASDNAWISFLQRHEACLLRAFQWRIDHASTDAAQVLCMQLPRLRGIHLDMCGLSRGA